MLCGEKIWQPVVVLNVVGDSLMTEDGLRAIQLCIPLQVPGAEEQGPLFLYSRHFMRPGAAAPPVEPVPDVQVGA